MTGTAGGLIVFLVILVLVAGEARRAAGGGLALPIIPLALLAGAILVARAWTILR